VCHEQAFHYLLEIERRRSDSTQRPFLLMLIDCGEPETGAAGGSARGPERLLSIVCQSDRETDFVGWYRQDTIVGAALTQDAPGNTTQAGRIVRDRIVKALHGPLPSPLVSRPRLRLYEVLGDDELRID
jgi:hypothetical protein